MKRAALVLVLFLLCVPFGRAIGSTGAAAEATPVQVPPSFDMGSDDEEMMASDPAGADLRVVVAAPRAAFIGRVASVIPVTRPGRSLNVVEGETVRFVSGVKEAVWYAGGGVVESSLAILQRDPGGGDPVLLGRDAVRLTGPAPDIDHARARVDVPFANTGTFQIDAAVRVGALPRNGRGVARSERALYAVKVWGAGELGGITGDVSDAADGSPLAGFRVVAIDPISRDVVSVAYSRCDGTYDLRRLPPGDYLVAVRPARGFGGQFFDGATDPATGTLVSVSAGSATPPIEFHLTKP